ncbi:MAG TPA: hypothetical protein VME17_24785 [Bryobacteraceae bacterium]|nr:hypothetical protein [Bryobacteraceae bacterium]
MNQLQTKIMLLAGLGVMAFLPAAQADQWNQRTVLTFSGPVEIPGQTLPAGTYVFKVANSQTSRHIVQVFNKDENHVFGTFLAIPSYRHKPSDKTIIRFEERAPGEPQAIKAWFYPTKTYGHEFVYPKNEAVALAQANNTPVPAMPTELAPNTTKPVTTIKAPEILAMLVVPLKAEEPSGEEVELAQASAPPTQGAGLPQELPATASPLPLIGLIGLLSLGSAAALRFAAARVK